MKTLSAFIITVIFTVLLTFNVHAGTRGVTKDTIVLGSHSDLSGPLASWGVASINGMKLRFKEINEAGGIHGRKIKFLVEDTRYQVPPAVKATHKLINRDKIFAMVGALGTPHNNAAMKIQFKANVPNLFPLSGAEAMGIPFEKLKFGYFTNYKQQMKAGVRYFVENKGVKSVCLQCIASDAGQEMLEGAEESIKEFGLEVKLLGRHKVTETEFVGAATKIKDSGCDLVVMGTAVKDTIMLYSTLRKLGWDKFAVTPMVSYMSLVAKSGEGTMNGLVGVVNIYDIDPESGNAAGKKFLSDYKAAYGAAPNNQAQTGYIFADLTVKALELVGKDLTVDSLVKAIESINDYTDPFGTSKASYGPKAHFGGKRATLVQIQNQKWEVVEESIPFD